MEKSDAAQEELRIWAVEKAIQSGAVGPEIMRLAQDLENFVLRPRENKTR